MSMPEPLEIVWHVGVPGCHDAQPPEVVRVEGAHVYARWSSFMLPVPIPGTPIEGTTTG